MGFYLPVQQAEISLEELLFSETIKLIFVGGFQC